MQQEHLPDYNESLTTSSSPCLITSCLFLPHQVGRISFAAHQSNSRFPLSPTCYDAELVAVFLLDLELIVDLGVMEIRACVDQGIFARFRQAGRQFLCLRGESLGSENQGSVGRVEPLRKFASHYHILPIGGETRCISRHYHCDVGQSQKTKSRRL